jgi:hypothetical protein
MLLYPIPVRMVGRKTGSEAKETLQEKYISCSRSAVARVGEFERRNTHSS